MKIQSQLIENFWHLIGHASDIESNGDYICLQIGDYDFAVYNDFGNVIAFDNRCPHRGTKFFDYGVGNAKLTCPYHGWTYTKGRLYVSERKRFDFDEEPSLNFLKLTFVGKWLFIAITPSLKIEDQLEGMYELLAVLGDQVEKNIDVNKYIYETFWPIAIENALEPYHITDIHPSTLANLNLTDGVDDFYAWGSCWRAEINDERMSKNLSKLDKFFDLNYQFKGYEFIYIFPFSMISNTFGYSYSVQNFFPRKDNESTNFISRFYAATLRDTKSEKILTSFFQSSIKLNREVFAEDHEICKRLDKNIWNAFSMNCLANNELKIQHFRQILNNLESNL